MKITAQHHKQMPYLKRLTEKLTVEQYGILESLLDVVYKEGHWAGKSEGYRAGNPEWDLD